MIRSNTGRLTAITLTVFGLALTASAQDQKGVEKTQRIDVEGIAFEVPASWKPIRSTSAMRKAQLRVSPAKGDTDPADLVLYVFPGGAGTIDDNIKRWQGQFKDANGETPDVEKKTLQGQNTEVTRAEIAGTYKDPFAPGGPKENYRLLGAIVQTDRAGYFLKMVGPDKTLKAAEPAFDRLIKSITIEK